MHFFFSKWFFSKSFLEYAHNNTKHRREAALIKRNQVMMPGEQRPKLVIGYKVIITWGWKRQ